MLQSYGKSRITKQKTNVIKITIHLKCQLKYQFKIETFGVILKDCEILESVMMKIFFLSELPSNFSRVLALPKKSWQKDMSKAKVIWNAMHGIWPELNHFKICVPCPFCQPILEDF